MADYSFKELITKFVAGFNSADFNLMSGVLSKNLEAHITNAEGGVNLWQGRDCFIDGIRKFDLENIAPKLYITQILDISPSQSMVMIEVKAERKGKSLHNFAAYLMFHANGEIQKMFMVEALPEYSDNFWND